MNLKRKTNLFYTEGTDSNFLTFSNYTEMLTRSIVSMNYKIFPSKFLCVKLKGTKDETIKYLQNYYENKLAVVRDHYSEMVENAVYVEDYIRPLDYLLNGPGVTFDVVCAGEISEQDYNGVYTDIICVLNANDIKGVEQKSETPNGTSISKTDYTCTEVTKLYGWSSDANVKTDAPIFDDSVSKYSIDTYGGNKVLTFNSYDNKTIEFDAVIPCVDVYDISNIDDKNKPGNAMVPLGIWFNQVNDTVETISMDLTNRYLPSWTLSISLQFKPFPYGNKYDVKSLFECDTNWAESKDAFGTFAQVFASQQAWKASYDSLLEKIASLESTITELKNNK